MCLVKVFWGSVSGPALPGRWILEDFAVFSSRIKRSHLIKAGTCLAGEKGFSEAT